MVYFNYQNQVIAMITGKPSSPRGRFKELGEMTIAEFESFAREFYKQAENHIMTDEYVRRLFKKFKNKIETP